MKSLDVRKYNMLVRVRDFGAARADLFPPGSLGARTFGQIGTIVDRLNASATSESSGRRATREGVVSRAEARTALRRGLEVIRRTAWGVALDAPDVLGKLRMPDGQNDHELATTARHVADAVAPLSQAFVEHGLPASFVADLQAAIAAFERTISEGAFAREIYAGARADITAAFDLAFDTLRRLDAIVENRVGGDPGALAAWRVARQVGRTPKRGGGPAPAAESSTPGAGTGSEPPAEPPSATA